MKYLLICLLPFSDGCFSREIKNITETSQTLGCYKLIRKMQTDKVKFKFEEYSQFCNTVYTVEPKGME